MKVVPDIFFRFSMVPFGLVIEAFTISNDNSESITEEFICTEQVRVTSDPLRTISGLLVTVTDCGSGTVERGYELL